MSVRYSKSSIAMDKFLSEMSKTTELNQNDSLIENTYYNFKELLSSLTIMLSNAIQTVVGYVDRVAEFIGPLVINLSSNIISLISNITALILLNKTNNHQAYNTWFKTLFITSLTTSFVAFANNIYIAIKNTSIKWDLESALAVIPQYFSSVQDSNITDWFNPKGHNLIKCNSDSFNINNFDLYKVSSLIIGAVASILIGGLALGTNIKWRDIVTGTQLLEGCKKTHKTLSDVSDYVLSEIFGYKSEVDYAVCKELEDLALEGTELQNKEPAHFVQHPDDWVSLLNYAKRIITITSKKVDVKTNSRYHTIKHMLIQTYKILCDKIDTVKAILATKQRQVTVGVVFSGPAAVGKSELSKYLSVKIGEALNYKPQMYTLNKKTDGFYEPYGGQAFAIYNEWMALRKEDPIVRDINLIFSSDPVNFEGAALDCKIQPNRLKVGFITCNMDNPNLTEVLNEQAVVALWDRLIHIRVDDPQCKGRQQPNPHRKPDFSHLRFSEIIHKSVTNIESKRMTMRELQNRLIGRTALEELNFIERLDIPDEELMQFEERKIELSNIIERNEPYRTDWNDLIQDDIMPNSDDAIGREFFTIRLQGNTGVGKTTLAGQYARRLSDQYGYHIVNSRSFSEFKIDKENPVIYIIDDWLKDELASEYIIKMNQTHPMSIFIICDNHIETKSRLYHSSFPIYKKLLTYLLDDGYVYGYDKTKSRLPIGYFRRIGLPGRIRLCIGEDVINKKSYLYTFRDKYIYDHNDKFVNTHTVINNIINGYNIYRNVNGQIITINKPPSFIPESHIIIQASDISSFYNIFRSISNLRSGLLNNLSGVNFICNGISIAAFSNQSNSAFDWLVDENYPQTKEDLLDLLKKFCFYIRDNIGDNIILSLDVAEIKTKYLYVNNTLYLYSYDDINEFKQFDINLENETINFKRDSATVYNITFEHYLFFKLYNKYVENMRNLTMNEISSLDLFIQNALMNPHIRFMLYQKYNNVKRHLLITNSPEFLSKKNSIIKHPLFSIGCGLLLILGAGYVVSKIVTALRGDYKEHDVDVEHKKFLMQEYGDLVKFDDYDVAYILGTDYNNAKSYIKTKNQAKIIERKIDQNTFGDHDGSGKNIERVSGKLSLRRSNNIIDNNKIEKSKDIANRVLSQISDIDKTINSSDKKIIQKEITQYLNCTSDNSDSMDNHLGVILAPDNYHLYQKATIAANQYGLPPKKESVLIDIIHKNMLSHQDMIKQRETGLDVMHKRLNKLYYRVVNETLGTCYGIGMMGRYILTVSHMFENVLDKCLIISNSTKYNAICVIINRDRDFAILYVTDKEFPMIQNTSRYFLDEEGIGNCMYGYFLRCGPECQIMGGYISYHPTTKYPLIQDAPLYKFKDKIIVFSALACHNISDFVKKGDCGFPLIVCDDVGQMKIAGIHNAYAESGKIYYGSFNKKDHHDMLDQAIRVTPNNLTKLERDTSLSEIEINDVESKFLIPTYYKDALMNLEPEIKFSHCEEYINILGFSRKLLLQTKPKIGHQFLDLPGMKSEITKIPAAFNMDYVIKPDMSKLVVDCNGEIDPLFSQCIKYDDRIKYTFDPDILTHSYNIVLSEALSRFSEAKLLNLYEVLNGKIGQYLAPVDPSTSCGPLLKILFNIQTKAPLLALSNSSNCRTFVFQDYDKSPAAKMVRNHFEEYDSAIQAGTHIPMILSKDCAKVEFIDTDKAIAGKVRLFNEIDFSINMVMKKYFGDLQNLVMENHHDMPIKIGQNPYKLATLICKQFMEIDGNIISTDFSAFDKTLPAILIKLFCRIAAQCYKKNWKLETPVEQIYDMWADALTYVLHTCKGTIYLVDHGNESGTFLTTMMNSFCLRMLTMYSVIKKWHSIHLFYPTLSNILAETRECIYGDDRTFKCSKLIPLTEEDFIADAKLFSMKCTSAKDDGEIAFCSRSLIWDEDKQLAWPALRKNSILCQIRWLKSFQKQQIIDNLDNCLFEAALHPDISIFDIVLNDINIILNKFNIGQLELSFTSRDIIRHRFRAYVFELAEFAYISSQAERELMSKDYAQKVIEHHRAISVKRDKTHTSDENLNDPARNRVLALRVQKLLSSELRHIMPSVKDNPVSAVLEALQACKIADKPVDSYTLVSQDEHRYTSEVLGFTGIGVGKSKRDAKRLAYSLLYAELEAKLDFIGDVSHNKHSSGGNQYHVFGERFMYKCVQLHLDMCDKMARETQQRVCVLAKNLPTLHRAEHNGIRYCTGEMPVVVGPVGRFISTIIMTSETAQSFPYELMKKVYLDQPKTVEFVDAIYVGCDDIQPNGDRSLGDTMQNVGLSTIPQLQNTVPVATVPAMTNPDPPAVGAFEPMLPIQDMNPVGPPNMLTAGAITFDIKDLVYSQFLDCDTMYQFGDDTPDGAIIFQIPYDPMSEFTNPYIKQYVRMHERYAGPLIFRFTVVGNQTFSGLLGLSWMPNRVEGTNIKISEGMKYNYFGEGINVPFTQAVMLHDARQNLFWRRSSENTEDDIKMRPHLVCYAIMPAISPLKEGIKVRIRVACKLPKTFQVSNPIIPGGTSGIGQAASGLWQNDVKRLQGLALIPAIVRPLFPSTNKFKILIDGNTYFKSPDFAISDYCYSKFIDEPGSMRPLYNYDDRVGNAAVEVVALRTFYSCKFRIKDDKHTTIIYLDLSRVWDYPKIKTKEKGSSYNYFMERFHKTVEEEATYPDEFAHALAMHLNEDNTTGLFCYMYKELQSVTDTKFVYGNSKGKKQFNLKPDQYITSFILTNSGPILITQINEIPIEDMKDTEFIHYDTRMYDELVNVNYITTLEETEALPAGWRYISITPDTPYANLAAQVHSSIPNHVSLKSLIEMYKDDIPTGSVLQIELADYESSRNICFIRYLPDRDIPVINVEDQNMMYGVSYRTCDKMFVSQVSVVPRANAFPVTVLKNNFADNQIPAIRRRTAIKDFRAASSMIPE